MNRLDRQCRRRKILVEDTLKVILTEKDEHGAKRPRKAGEQCNVVFSRVTFEELGREKRYTLMRQST